MTHRDSAKPAGALSASAATPLPATSTGRTSEHLSRRGLIAAALATSLVPAAALAATETSPDAALLDAGERLRAAWKAEDAVCAREHTDADEVGRRIVLDEIEGMRATTVAGLQAKALAISWCCNGEPFAEEDDTTDNRLVESLLDDLMSMEVAYV